MDCLLITNNRGQCECTVCGRTFRKLVADCESVHRNCGAVPIDNGQPQLGDRLETLLTSIGITEERYKDFKESLGLDPTCGCKKRKEALNRFGEWFGQKARMALEAFGKYGHKDCWRCGAPAEGVCACGQGECAEHPHHCREH